MRVAISGSHSLGKSTFVKDFLNTHLDYAFEEEPYRALMHQHDIKFAEDQTQRHIMLQLDFVKDGKTGFKYKTIAVGFKSEGGPSRRLFSYD